MEDDKKVLTDSIDAAAPKPRVDLLSKWRALQAARGQGEAATETPQKQHRLVDLIDL